MVVELGEQLIAAGVLPEVGVTEWRGQSKVMVHRARKAHECGECGAVIAPGDRYAEWTAAPWHPFNPNRGHWSHLRVCPRHPVYWPLP